MAPVGRSWLSSSMGKPLVSLRYSFHQRERKPRYFSVFWNYCQHQQAGVITPAYSEYRTSLRCFGSSSIKTAPPENKQDTPASGDNNQDTIQRKEDKAAPSSTSDPSIVTAWERILPTTWHPYVRLARMDKPIGTMLLLWPCWWSTALATEVGAWPDPYLLVLFTTGAFVMRGAGCTINDLWDRDIDRKVRRTATRPLASGELQVPQALSFLALQLSTGLAVLVSLPHTWYCFQWGAASLPLVAIYPATKRFFPYPQLILGLTFNWGAWMGWAAVYGQMDYGVVAPLYLSGVTWTLIYDTIYAHQDKSDDSTLGLHSTALAFGSDVTTQKRILYGLATTTWLLWLWVGHVAPQQLNLVYDIGTTAAFGHLLRQIQTADFNDPHNCALRFRSNNYVGATVFASFVAGSYLAGG